LQECFRSAQRWLTSISEGLRHMSGMGARFALLWRRHAFVLGVLATGAKTCLADILVQTQMEGKKRREIDWRRNLTFSSFGIFYLGIFQAGLTKPLYCSLESQILETGMKFAGLPKPAGLTKPLYCSMCSGRCGFREYFRATVSRPSCSVWSSIRQSTQRFGTTRVSTCCKAV